MTKGFKKITDTLLLPLPMRRGWGWAFLLLLVTACSTVDEDQRLIYVKPAEVARNVLIEDFTGQRCVNCPVATQLIEQLQEEYGDAVIPVGIHSGPLGFAGNATTVGLSTAIGDEYYSYFNIAYQPQGMIDRSGGPLAYTDWQAAVYRELQKTAPLAITITTDYDASSRQLTIDIETMGTDGETAGKLQVWLTEDDVQALQLRFNDISDPSSGQITDREYRHNHVFRDVVNGTWGDEVTIREGETTHHTFTYQLNDQWQAEKMAVVAFVYNAQGVQQVERAKVLH